ncbi:MAG: divalent-cation tolerance protein CutA [Candidatus Sumerlaeia bacterium]
MSGCIFVYITNPDQETAVRVARHLLERRLIACANIHPITSLYWWQGKIEEGGEVVLIAKTMPERFEAVRREVEAIHPYSVPCIVEIDANANESWFTWLRQEIEHSG